MAFLVVDETTRLRSLHESDIDHALAWYADPVVLNGTIAPGRTEPCSRDMIVAMYDDLSYESDFYIIEVLKDKTWIPIGDVTLANDCMPIVIGEREYRGKGLSKKVMQRLLEFAREKGLSEINVKEIYRTNTASIKLFEGLGFKKVAETPNGHSYKITL